MQLLLLLLEPWFVIPVAAVWLASKHIYIIILGIVLFQQLLFVRNLAWDWNKKAIYVATVALLWPAITFLWLCSQLTGQDASVLARLQSQKWGSERQLREAASISK